MAMRQLARLQQHLSPSLLHRHAPRHAWPPAAGASFLCRGLASSVVIALRGRRRVGSGEELETDTDGVAVAFVYNRYSTCWEPALARVPTLSQQQQANQTTTTKAKPTKPSAYHV
ncbi:unnamed protein product [Urochloa humidicola]